MIKKFFEAVTVGLSKSFMSFWENCWWAVCMSLAEFVSGIFFSMLANVFPVLDEFEVFFVFFLLSTIFNFRFVFFMAHCYDAVKYASENQKDTMAEAWEATTSHSYMDED